MTVNSVTEAKAHLSGLIERAIAGEETIICRAGKPVAVLTAYRASRSPREPGALRGKIRVHEDFDELPDDIASSFGVR